MTQPTTAGAGRPSAECLRNVQLSCQLLQRHESRFVDSVFTKVLEDVRWAWELGAERSRPLCDGLARSVLWAGLTQDSDELIGATMRDIGARYRRQGVPGEWYREFGKALLFAVRQMQPGEWGSLLSSDWVAYYMWLSEFIRAGALEAQSQGGLAGELSAGLNSGADTGFGNGTASGADLGSGTGPGAASAATPPEIRSLTDIVTQLRTRYFPDNDRALTTICTRVALRTGTDLRNPRPDQRTDPIAIANVLSTLLVLGYSLQTFSIEDASAPEDAYEPTDPDNPDSTAEAGAHAPGGRSRALRRRVSRIFGLARGYTRGER